jgi:hypothetical protein
VALAVILLKLDGWVITPLLLQNRVTGGFIERLSGHFAAYSHLTRWLTAPFAIYYLYRLYKWYNSED